MQVGDCRTRDDIVLHLVSWLQWIPPSEQPTIEGWTQVMGYRRAFNTHQVWRHTSGRYAFHVNDPANEHDDFDQSSFSANIAEADTFEALLHRTADRYSTHWTPARSRQHAPWKTALVAVAILSIGVCVSLRGRSAR